MRAWSSALGLCAVLLSTACASTPSVAPPGAPSAGAGIQPGTGAAPTGAATGSAMGSPSGEVGTSSEGDGSPDGSVPDGGAMTPKEETATLDGELQESLEEFDEMLSREQEQQAKRREAASGAPSGAMGGSASGGAQAGESGAEGGSAEGTSGGGMVDGEEGDDEATMATDRSGMRGHGADPRVPADVGDGSDDDIVARQIREAALKEEDPELREKLWDEYRAYKRGQASGDR